jgi:PhoPQ-activated pathogenicity-related protein
VIIFIPNDQNYYQDIVSLVDGGSKLTPYDVNRGSEQWIDVVKDLANSTNSVGVYMNGVPAHITYQDHNDINYGENELMGKMWNRYVFETGDIQDSFLGPMTKSAVRCMDAAEGYLKEIGYVTRWFLKCHL